MSNQKEFFNSSRHFLPEKKYRGRQKISLTYLDNLLSDDYLSLLKNVLMGCLSPVNRPKLQNVRN